MWISRTVTNNLKDLVRKKPAVLVTGCRQTGKTSILKNTFPDYNYVSLDLPLLAEEAESSGEDFLKKYKAPLIIDEVQYAPELMHYIKIAIEKNRSKKGQYLLTGSQQFFLMQGITESLAGRISLLTLHSLSLEEILTAFPATLTRNKILKYCLRGGFPELYISDISSEQFYSDYLATYIERDVRQMINIKSLRDFNRFIKLLAIRSGSLLSMNSIASEVGVSVNTIKSWLSVLEASNIISLLEPYFRNLGKRLVKTPKIYFTDTGLLLFLLGISDSKTLEKSSMLGNIFETLVLGQFLRAYAGKAKRPNLYFYRDHYGHEIDFVIPVAEKLKLFESKWSAKPKLPNRGFSEMEKLIGTENILAKVIITPANKKTLGKDNTTITNCLDLKEYI